MRVLRCGADAVLVEVDGLAEVVALHAGLRAAPPPGVEELVPAARTVLVRFDPEATSVEALTAALGAVESGALGAIESGPAEVLSAGPVVELPTVYDGADLTEVAEFTGLTVDEVVARHESREYTVAFCGFSPGFGYLVGGDPALVVPRRDTPRTKVPPGSVALADVFTGVYPRALPGGWRLIGRTDAALWDLDRDPPALLVPGARVRFVR